MKQILLDLANQIKIYDNCSSNDILLLAGRYDKINSTNTRTQPAFKYIMYLKLMHNIDDASFHYLKRKYLNTKPNIQEECRKELDKIISNDSIKFGLSSAEIYKKFYELLSKVDLNYHLK